MITPKTLNDVLDHIGEGIVTPSKKEEKRATTDEELDALYGVQKKKTLWQRIRKVLSRLMVSH